MPAPPFFDLPLFGEVRHDFLPSFKASVVPQLHLAKLVAYKEISILRRASGQRCKIVQRLYGIPRLLV